MFERFSKDARQVVIQAQEQARDRADTRIGSEHLLVACLTVDVGVAEKLGLSSTQLSEGLADLDMAALRSVGVEQVISDRGSRPKGRRGHIPFTGGGKQILEEALQEAIANGDRKIEVGHILLAITKLPPTDRASRLLSVCGVDPQEMRRELLSAMRKAS